MRRSGATCSTWLLESTGTISFIGRRPTPEVTRHEGLLRRLDQMARELAALRVPVRPAERPTSEPASRGGSGPPDG